MSHEPPRDRDPVPRFLGWLLLVVGVLWMAFAGICTASVLLSPSGADNAGWTTLIVIIGLVCMAAGFGIFMLGRVLARN